MSPKSGVERRRRSAPGSAAVPAAGRGVSPRRTSRAVSTPRVRSGSAQEVRCGGTPQPARETRALPGGSRLRRPARNSTSEFGLNSNSEVERRALPFRVAQPSLLLAEASRLSELHAMFRLRTSNPARRKKFVAAGRRNQHAGRVCYPEGERLRRSDTRPTSAKLEPGKR